MFPASIVSTLSGAKTGRPCRNRVLTVTLALLFATFAPVTRGASAAGSPISKVYFAAVRGADAFVHQGDRSQPISPKETYAAAGLGIETQAGAIVTMVFSNGLAVQLHADTRLKVKRFAQEPFRPNRTDIQLEPSISDVELDLAYGTMVISTAKLVPGSRLNLETNRAEVNAQGGTMIVTANPEETDVSVVTGACTIYGHNDGTHFDAVKEGEMAKVHLAATDATGAVVIEVTPMTKPELATLTGQTDDITLAKRTVYFDQRSTGAFNSTTAISSPETDNTANRQREALELNAVQVIPEKLPVQYTISPAYLLPTSGG